MNAWTEVVLAGLVCAATFGTAIFYAVRMGKYRARYETKCWQNANLILINELQSKRIANLERGQPGEVVPLKPEK